MIFVYPVQRQRTPLKPSRISSPLAEGLSFNNVVDASNIPGVQTPHCIAPF